MDEALRKQDQETSVSPVKQDSSLGRLTQGFVDFSSDLIDEVQDAVGVRDLSDRMVFWSKGAERMYGWTANEVLGRKSTELFYQELPQKRAEADRIVREKGEWRGELAQVTKSGRVIMVDSRWKLLLDSQKTPIGILATNTDITEKKQMEAQFLRAQRMEAIGTLSSGIAHDLNNILSPILISVQLLRSKQLDEESSAFLATIEQCANRGAEVVKQVLTFGRGIKGERVTVQPRYLVSEIGKIARETFPKTIRVEIMSEPNLWSVTGDTTQLHQVLLNLCVNARDAMANGGVLSLRAENILVDEHYAKMVPSAKPGAHVLIQVSDTGHGIPSEIINRIFDPFFTTKELGKGSGLGLSTAVGIVESHSGFMTVESSLGKGSIFKVFLPSSPGMDTPASSCAPSHLPEGQGELVLVVDDERDIREISRKILTRHGYQVMVAEDGTDGVSVFAQNQDKIKLVLTDIMMPFMDGLALARALRKIKPEIKIIASSGLMNGLGQSEKVAELERLGVETFLSKPYTAEKLLNAIKNELSEDCIA